MLTTEEKDKVFQAAKEIFSTLPLSQVDMKKLAEHSGVDEKKITSEFKSPRDILHTILVQGINEVTKLFIRMVDARGKADIKLLRMVRELLRLYEMHAPLFRLTSINFLTLDEIDLELRDIMSKEELDKYRQNTAIIGRIIAQGQSEGLFVKDIDPLESAYILRGMINAAIMYWQLLRKDEPLHTHAELVARLFLKGVYK